MLDLNYIRENAPVVKENLKKRGAADMLRWVDELLQLDAAWREERGKADQLRSRRNRISEEINAAKKAGKNPKDVIEDAKKLPERIAAQESKAQELRIRMDGILMRLPNLLHHSVPVGKDDAGNVTIKTFGKKPALKNPVSHVDLLAKWDLADTERAAKITGARWYFLKGDLARLEMALSAYAVDFMRKKGYALQVPPLAMTHDAYKGVTELSAFEDVLYKVENDDLHLIATSEHPLTAQFMGETLEEDQLPIKLVGYSTCFRKEAGTHGKDEKGIFRVHQFNKVEQIIVCRPENSWDFHEELLRNAVEFFQSLGLHGRVVNICTGDIGIVAAKKYDIEVWMPAQQAYREVVSCSNCTGWQATRLGIRVQRKGGERVFAHTLNSTCVATSRALVAILENCQRPDGTIEIPSALHRYCGFKLIGKAQKAAKKK